MHCESGCFWARHAQAKSVQALAALNARSIRRATFLKGCRVAEAARSDRLGKGAPQKIEPLTGVLAKILQRKQAIIDR